MTQLHVQQHKHKLTGSSVNEFKIDRKKCKLSSVDKLFMLVGFLFLSFIFISAFI